MVSIKYILFTIVLVLGLKGLAQQKKKPSTLVIYKRIDTMVLKMDIVYPPNLNEKGRYKSIAFFYGGGWRHGSIEQFRSQANHLAKRGMVCFLIDYRTQDKNGTTPFESLKDAKSAIRFIRKNATNFHINTDSIVASGGSAGGHLAAAAAFIDNYNESTDDLSISAKPNALVLFNPVIDNGPGGYGFERIGKEYKSFSPLHNIQKNAPPSIILLGTKDKLIPVETVQYYKTVMQKVGSRCDLFLYEGQGHGFYKQEEYGEKTLFEVDKFLTALGYLN